MKPPVWDTLIVDVLSDYFRSSQVTRLQENVRWLLEAFATYTSNLQERITKIEARLDKMEEIES